MASIKNFTILEYYDQHRQKMQLYKEDIIYDFLKWVKKTSYQKINKLGTKH